MKALLNRLIPKLAALPLALVCLWVPVVESLELISPTPGTQIDNRAEAYLLLGDDLDNVVVIPSNLARAVVGFDYGLRLETDNQLETAPGQIINFPHRLTNLGNTPDTYLLDVANIVGDDGDLTNLLITLDTNGNGVPDSGEPVITETPTVEAGEILSLVVTGLVPASVVSGQEVAVELNAVSTGDSNEFAQNTDTLEVREGALLRFTKTSSVACSIPVLAGDSLTYSIVWTNSGDQNPAERLHMVDGIEQSGVMIEDRLSPDVDLVHGQDLTIVPFSATAVVMTSDGLVNNEWISYSAWDGVDPVARLGLLTPSTALRSNQSGTLVFDVEVAQNVTLNTVIRNRVVVDENGDDDFEFASAEVCNTAGGPEAEIRFLSPTFDNILNQDAPDFGEIEDFSDSLRYRFDAGVVDYDATYDGVYVELQSTSIPDSNLQFLEDGRRQVVVNVTSSVSGQSVPTLVRETELGSGVYLNVVPLVLSLSEDGTGQLCGDLAGAEDYISTPPDSCVLRSGQEDSLTVSFFDRGLGEVIDDASIVDPLGFVFDSITREVIPGVQVLVFNAIDNGPGGLKDELANDPFAPPGTPLEIQVTDENGFYQYPFMFAGTYYQTVVIPENFGYVWPSERSPLLYPGTDVSDFSYGRNGFSGVIDSGTYVLDEDNPIVAVDFPIDPVEMDLVVNGSVTCDIDASTDDPIFYSATFANSGNLEPPERDILVDGVVQSGVLIEGRVPLNTILDTSVAPVFSPASAQLVLKLYDGTAADNWVAYATWLALPEATRPLVSSLALLVPGSDLEPAGVGILGEGGDLTYGVLITGNITAGTQIVNQLTVDLDGDGEPEISGDEDFQDACEVSSGPEPAIRFLAPDNAGAEPVFDQDDTFVDTGTYFLDGIGSPYDAGTEGTYIELNSTSISTEDFTVLDDGRRRIVVAVDSGATSDSVEVVLEEVGYATGVYRSIRPLVLHDTDTGNGGICPPTATGADYAIDPGPECVLTSEINDLLTVSFVHRFEADTGTPDETLTDEATVAPVGFVFLSSGTFDPVPNAIVRIMRVTGPGTSEVAAGPLVTAANGSFPFPSLPNGDYFVEVEGTDTFSFASVADIATLQANSGYAVEAFSFGLDSGNGVFSITDANPFQVFDIPVDVVDGDAALVVTKLANAASVEIGGLIEYSVTVSNVGDGGATDVELLDILPFGFKYIERTARRDGVIIADPAGTPGPELVFDLGDLDSAESTEIKYVLQATSGAIDSDGINTAQANGQSGGDPVISNEARVQVDIQLSGVLSDKGIVFGKIFVDADCNNIQSQGEWPVGGVTLYMEDGTYAITDENGQYSIYGINPGMHSIKIDSITLPEGLNMKPIDNRNLADPESRLVDLQNGEFHRADFAAACPHPSEADMVYAQVAARNASIQGDWLTENSASFDVFERAVALAAQSGDDLSSGRILSAGQLDSGSNQLSPIFGLNTDIDLEATSEEEVATAVIVDEVIYEIEREQGREGMWLWPADNMSLYGRFVVAVRDRVVANLYINDVLVPREQLGDEAHNTATDVQVLAWYGVSMSPGENLVEVRTTDLFGNERVLLSKTYINPGQAVSLSIEPEDDILAADGGRSLLPVRISVLDESGYPARGIHFVTVEPSDGRIAGTDLQPENPGFQVRLDRGTAEVQLQSSNQTGDVEIRVSNDNFDESVWVDFVSAQRSLIVSGIASTSVGICDIDGDGYAPTAADCEDGLADERIALFMKGSIRNNLFLTLSYDSDKADEELLRDINPDEYYPIFGDSSIRGYEAQSRSKLYAKLELDRSSLQWGDFVTDRTTSFQDLGRVQRSLTGLSLMVEEDAFKAEAFAAEVEDTRETIEIPGNGTAMLFRIPNAPIVRNSEVIEYLVRDRDNTGLVVSAVNLTRFVDYTVDHLSGDIRFTRTIPTIDADLNPVSLRISYDVEGDGGTDLVAGVRASYEVTEELVVGGGYTSDGNETTGFDLASAFVEYKPTEQSRIFISSASMDHQDAANESGNALYAALEMTWENGSNTGLSFGRADEGFTNTGSGVSSDRQELNVSHVQTLTKTLSLDAEFIRSERLSVSESRQSLELGVDYALGDWTLSLGGRRIEQESAAATSPEDANTIVAGAGRSFTLFDRRGNVNLELEREIGEQNRKRWALGTSWQATEKLNVYGNFEQINSLTGPSALNAGDEKLTANFGVEMDILPSTSIFNEYRLRGVTDSRDLQASTGVRGDYVITEGLTFTPTAEIINILDGDTGQDSVAISLSLEDLRNKNARALGRIESRFDEDREYYGLDLSYVARVSLDWSSFIREELSYTKVFAEENELSHELTLGMTYRPRETNQYHALYMYQWSEDRGSSLLDDTSMHLLSTHQNYQFNEALRLSGRLGAKYETTPLLDMEFSSLTAVMDTRLIWDITRRLDIDVHGGVIGTNGFEETRYSLGAGLSYLVMQGLRVGVGYNFTGFDEGDLDSEGYNEQGFYIHAEYKFDEDLFHWLESDLYRREEEE